MIRAVEVSLFPDLRADKAVGPLPPSVVTGSNADLITKVAPLYLTGSVLETTYGEGGWWRRYRPDGLIITAPGTDFRALPFPDSAFDTVCFDPPYVVSGGESATAADFRARYGIDVPRSDAELDDLLLDGLVECARVAGAWVLCKCMDQVSGGRFRPRSYRLVARAAAVGVDLWDEVVHHTGSGPGGGNIVEPLRARRHHSKLLVFRAVTR